jgi:hypothetical protein
MHALGPLMTAYAWMTKGCYSCFKQPFRTADWNSSFKHQHRTTTANISSFEQQQLRTVAAVASNGSFFQKQQLYGRQRSAATLWVIGQEVAGSRWDGMRVQLLGRRCASVLLAFKLLKAQNTGRVLKARHAGRGLPLVWYGAAPFSNQRTQMIKLEKGAAWVGGGP